MVVLAVDLKLIVSDHLLNFHVSMRWIGVETVTLRTFLPCLLLATILERQWFQLVETMLTDFVAVLHGDINIKAHIKLKTVLKSPCLKKYGIELIC